MSLFGNLTAHLPGTKNSPQTEYFFALNIGPEKLIAGLWSVEGDKFRVVNTAVENYSSSEEIIKVTDQLLDAVLGDLSVEPNKILFGVQDSWLVDDDLKDPYLKILKQLVKELELTPMAYVATSHALVHFLEKQDGSPITAILVGIGKKFVTVASVRAGKLDGSISSERGSDLGGDIEKIVSSVAKSDVLPAKILIYGEGNLDKQKSELLSHPWMSKLSFLHFPKIEVLESNLEITAISLAGAVELNPQVKVDKNAAVEDKSKRVQNLIIDTENPKQQEDPKVEPAVSEKTIQELTPINHHEEIKKESTDKNETSSGEELGFVAGDVTQMQLEKDKAKKEAADILDSEQEIEDLTDAEFDDEEISEAETFTKGEIPETELLAVDDYSPPLRGVATGRTVPEMSETAFSSKGPIVKKIKVPALPGMKIWLGLIVIAAALAGAYVFLPKAVVQIYVEPRILEKETQVIADPSIKEIDSEGKKIPGEIIETQISGSGKGVATGKKQIGDPAKGVVVFRNKTNKAEAISKGTILIASNGLKFSLEKSVSIASASADDGTWSKANGEVVAVQIGPDGNLPSGMDMSISGFSTEKMVAKTEGNFSGGTSKDVTVVTADDQKKLLADVASDLRKKAKDELQVELNSKGEANAGKKVLEETLTEEITKKVYSKNVNDQANEFSVDLIVKYKGTAFAETDLRTTVAKLVGTNIPEDFMLNLSEAETQADVAKIDKDGKVTFTAKFKAKLMPKIDTDKIKKQLIGKTPMQAAEILKTYENVLGSDITISPKMPEFLQRLPILEKNIKVDVGLK